MGQGPGPRGKGRKGAHGPGTGPRGRAGRGPRARDRAPRGKGRTGAQGQVLGPKIGNINYEKCLKLGKQLNVPKNKRGSRQLLMEHDP